MKIFFIFYFLFIYGNKFSIDRSSAIFFFRKAIEQLTNFKRVLKIRIVLEGTNAVRKWSLTSSLMLVVTWKLFRYWYGSAGTVRFKNVG